MKFFEPNQLCINYLIHNYRIYYIAREQGKFVAITLLSIAIENIKKLADYQHKK